MVGDTVRLVRPVGAMPTGATGEVYVINEYGCIYADFRPWGVGGVDAEDVEVVTPPRHDEGETATR